MVIEIIEAKIASSWKFTTSTLGDFASPEEDFLNFLSLPRHQYVLLVYVLHVVFLCFLEVVLAL